MSVDYLLGKLEKVDELLGRIASSGGITEADFREIRRLWEDTSYKILQQYKDEAMAAIIQEINTKYMISTSVLTMGLPRIKTLMGQLYSKLKNS